MRIRTRQHWIVLLAPPHKWPAIFFLALLVAALVDPDPIAWAFGVVALSVAAFRWWTWRADFLTLTGKRIIRTQGIPDIASAESSLRLDRISGLRLVETLWGNLLGYASIELEAPGEHPGVRQLRRISHADDFYLALRAVIFGEPTYASTDGLGDPIGPARGGRADTAPLPHVPPRGEPSRREPSRREPPRREPGPFDESRDDPRPGDEPRRDRFGRRTDWE